LYSTFVLNSIGSVYGEWLQIQSNVPVVMSSFALNPWVASALGVAEMPKIIYICGSTDNYNWYPIIQMNFSVLTSAVTSYFTIPAGSGSTTGTVLGTTTYSSTTYGNSTNSYSYFRMIVTHVYGPGTNGQAYDGWLSIGSWLTRFTQGANPTGPTRSLVYMDASNINQLDVSGSLALVNSAPTLYVSPNTTAANNNYWSSNNITWDASASSFFSTSYYPAFGFNKTFVTSPTGTGWLSGGEYYSRTTGLYAATATGSTTIVNGTSAGVSVKGDWLQIRSSSPVIMQSYYLTTIYNTPADLAKTYGIAASNDGTNWYYIHDGAFTAWPGIQLSTNTTTAQSTNSYTVANATNNSTQNSNNTINNTANCTNYGTYQSLSYTYFRFIIKSLCNGSFSAAGAFGTARGFYNFNFTVPTSSVSMSLDNVLPNQLNVGGSLGVLGGITPIYTTPIIGPNQIGYILSIGTLSGAVANNYYLVPTPGVWIAFAYIEVATNQNSSFYYGINIDNIRRAFAVVSPITGTNYQYLPAISCGVQCTGSTIVNLNITIPVATNFMSPNPTSHFYCLRIA